MAPPGSNASTRPRAIGIDGGTWGNRRGYGRFLRELLPEIVKLRPDWRFVVFLDQPRNDVFEAANLEWIVAGTGKSVAEGATAAGARSAVDLLRMGQAVNRVKLDLLFFPTVYSYFPVLRRIPIVVGIHDTMADRYPEWAFAGKRQEVLWRAKVRMALAQADRIITVSQYSRRSIGTFFQVDPSRIAVIPEAASPLFVCHGTPRDSTILAVGGISPNKNLAVLVRALPALLRQYPAVRLCIVGDYATDGFQGCYRELRALIDECGVAGHVDFAGYVPDNELALLYNRCGVFAMPSLEEGFGLPLAEAMVSGCACVVSTGHALEELGGDAVLLASGIDEEAWTTQLGRLIGDPELRQRLGTAAAERLRAYTWTRSADHLAGVFEELLCR